MNLSKVEALEAELAHVHHEYTMLEQLLTKYIDAVTDCEGYDFITDSAEMTDDDRLNLFRLSSYRNEDGTWRRRP
jgi:hypothetical protein